MNKQVNKVSIVGPMIIGGLVLVAAGTGIYTVIKTNNIVNKINSIESQVVTINNELKLLHANIEKKGSDDLATSIKSVLNSIEEGKLEAKRSDLYKGWDNVSRNKEGRYIYGNPEARFTMVNYEDLECPYCKRFAPTPKYLVDTANNGAVNWEWRHFNLSSHEPMATKAAMTAECVGQQKGAQGFWALTHYWFEKTEGNGKGFPTVDDIPTLFNVDKDKFDGCMSDKNIIQRIKVDMEQGIKDQVTGTPTTIIIDNKTGKRFKLVGAQPFAKFVEVIQSMVKGLPIVSEDEGAGAEKE